MIVSTNEREIVYGKENEQKNIGAVYDSSDGHMLCAGETVDRKVYAITEKGRREYLTQIQQSTLADFISRDSFLMQLYFSEALDRNEQIRLLDTKLQNIKKLEQNLINLYNEKLEKFLVLSGLTQDDPRFRSPMWAYDWELIKCNDYAKFLETIKPVKYTD